MTCTEVRKLLPDLALGDLDAEPAAGVAAHLKGCADCRAEDAGFGRTLGALRAARPVAASTERRSAAVAAMARTHADQAEKLLVRRPRPSWVPWATAAAFLLALAGALSLRGTATAFTVESVSGRAELRDRDSGLWRPVLGGSAVSVGDRLVTYEGCRVRLAAGSTEILLDQDTSIEVARPRRVGLDRGRILAFSSEAATEPLVVTDLSNNAVRVRGRVELAVRDVKGTVGGAWQEKGGRSVIPEMKDEIRRLLVVRVQSGEAALGGSRDQRLNARAGEEGKFQFDGKPETSVVTDPAIGTWAENR